MIGQVPADKSVLPQGLLHLQPLHLLIVADKLRAGLLVNASRMKPVGDLLTLWGKGMPARPAEGPAVLESRPGPFRPSKFIQVLLLVDGKYVVLLPTLRVLSDWPRLVLGSAQRNLNSLHLLGWPMVHLCIVAGCVAFWDLLNWNHNGGVGCLSSLVSRALPVVPPYGPWCNGNVFYAGGPFIWIKLFL